jgi:5-methylcytosine-specific restriction endonuclease McrA
MSQYISENLRRQVADRALHRCEYCHIREDDTFLGFQIDHIISLKHGGPTELENLAWACFACNNSKGSNVGTVLLPDKRFTRLFNPREDIWSEHFETENAVIYSGSDIGQATIKVLKLNDIDRIIERQVLDL